jgi:type II restriction/modification system DNA methylase subunit YeeA
LQVNRIFIPGFIIKVKGILIMLDSPQEKAEKDKVIKKLMSKWLKVQETERKASLLLSKNPELKITGTGKSRRIS